MVYPVCQSAKEWLDENNIDPAVLKKQKQIQEEEEKEVINIQPKLQFPTFPKQKNLIPHHLFFSPSTTAKKTSRHTRDRLHIRGMAEKILRKKETIREERNDSTNY